MSSKDPVFERSRSVEDMQHLRLMALLSELVRDKGVMQAAQELEVDHRTLTAGLESGRLSRRLRGALEKALLEGGGSPAQEQRERNDALEARVEVLEKGVEALGREMRQGLAAVQGEVRTLREQQTQGMRRLARLETGEDAPDGDRNADSGGDGKARGRPAPRRKTVLRREFPELATLEPAGDDEGVFGQAWPLILEWRALKETHPDRGKGLDWLAAGRTVPHGGAGPARGARAYPAAGDVPVARPGPGRAGQLAAKGAG